MKYLILVMLLSINAFAQSNLAIDQDISALPAQAVNFSLTLTSPAGKEPAAIQWTFVWPPGLLGSVIVTATPMATSAGKSISCDSTSSKCLLAGLNQNIIPNGTVANVQFVSAPSALGQYPITMTDTAGSFADGTSAMLSWTGGFITINSTGITPTPTPTPVPLPAGSILVPTNWVRPVCDRSQSGRWVQTQFSGKDTVSICVRKADYTYFWKYIY